ncbi:lytic murein transglycosylase B [Paraferrimonas haliotis]|nr:lytic murein transglycosylase B [Paraferrimonas haliotis]
MNKPLLAVFAFCASLLTGVAFSAQAQAQQATPSELKQEFINTQLEKGFTQPQIDAFLAPANISNDVLEAIARPWEAKPWHQYYPIFLTEERVQGGIEFWKKHQKTLQQVSEQYGVEPEIIVSIIGVETYYGRFKGTHKVLDALYSLGFYYPPRARFFRSELGHLMELAREQQLDLSELKGSYAGAMGFGQFIPSSYRAYAVDFDGDGRIDLVNSEQDAIASVANYFKRHGWVKGQQVIKQVELTPGTDASALVWDKKPPKYLVADWISKGVKFAKNQDMDVSQKAILVELELEQGADYYLGLNNFYAITRYNHSPLYAMAVYRLSQQIKAAYHARR